MAGQHRRSRRKMPPGLCDNDTDTSALDRHHRQHRHRLGRLRLASLQYAVHDCVSGSLDPAAPSSPTFRSRRIPRAATSSRAAALAASRALSTIYSATELELLPRPDRPHGRQITSSARFGSPPAGFHPTTVRPPTRPSVACVSPPTPCCCIPSARSSASIPSHNKLEVLDLPAAAVSRRQRATESSTEWIWHPRGTDGRPDSRCPQRAGDDSDPGAE